MIYPKKLNVKNSEKILHLSLVISLVVAIILIVINRLTTPGMPWAALANCGIVYIWITVIYCIKKNINIAGHVLIQTIAISIVTLYIDDKLGFKGWSLDIAIPIILIVANTTMLILTMVSRKKYIKYAIYQLMLVILSLAPVFFLMNNLMELKVLSKISIIISALNLTITLILCYKDVKEAVIRKVHM